MLLPLIGQQGEDLGIKLRLGQLPDALDEDFIRQGSEPQAGIGRQLAAKAELIKKLGAEAGEGLFAGDRSHGGAERRTQRPRRLGSRGRPIPSSEAQPNQQPKADLRSP